MLFKKILRLSRRIFFEDFEVLLPQCDKVQKAARSRTIMKGIRDDSGWNDLAFCTRIKAGSIAELLASCFDRVYVMPDADASALPTGYDRATRVVTMAGYAPESGSYLVTQ